MFKLLGILFFAIIAIVLVGLGIIVSVLMRLFGRRGHTTFYTTARTYWPGGGQGRPDNRQNQNYKKQTYTIMEQPDDGQHSSADNGPQQPNGGNKAQQPDADNNSQQKENRQSRPKDSTGDTGSESEVIIVPEEGSIHPPKIMKLFDKNAGQYVDYEEVKD